MIRINERFETERAAAEAWAADYRSRSRTVEYAAFILSRPVRAGGSYYLSRTLRGMGDLGPIRANTVGPLIVLYLFLTLPDRLRGARLAAFIHSHPEPGPGYTSGLLSREDKWVVKIPGISAIYAIPYENHEFIRFPETA